MNTQAGASRFRRGGDWKTRWSFSRCSIKTTTKMKDVKSICLCRPAAPLLLPSSALTVQHPASCLHVTGNRLVDRCGPKPQDLCTPCRPNRYTDGPANSKCNLCTQCIGKTTDSGDHAAYVSKSEIDLIKLLQPSCRVQESKSS